MLGFLNIKHFVMVLLICRNILCQPTVFTKQWYKDTNCITDENDILTTLEFILVDLQRLRFDTKQLKDDSTLIKTNFVRIRDGVNHIKTQNKKFGVVMNKLGSKISAAETETEGFKDVLLEVNRTLTGVFYGLSGDIYRVIPKVPAERNNVPVFSHENEIPNEIIVKPITIEESDNDNIYFEKTENEIENYGFGLPEARGNNFKAVEGKSNGFTGEEMGKLLDPDQDYDIQIETFSGEEEIADENTDYTGSGFNEETPANTDVPSDQMNTTSVYFEGTDTIKETSASDSPKSADINDSVVQRDNTASTGSKQSRIEGSHLPELEDAERRQDVFKDCSDVPTTTSGIVIISPSGSGQSFPVYCQFQDNDHWLVFQRRLNGEVDFYRNWFDYKNGFGQLDGEFWLGNENLHLITAQYKYMLRIDMWDWDSMAGEGFGKHFYAESNYIYVDTETEFYRLHVPVGFYDYTGFGGSGLRVHAGPFMTYDKRHPDMRNNCAQLFHTGWWFKTCVRNANLNGKYYPGGYAIPENHTRAQDGIFWRNIPRSLKKVEMKLKKVV